MHSNEYPHQVTFLEQTKIPDGSGGYEIVWKAVLTISAFMDTPSSGEIFQAQQLQNPLDRNLYYSYRTDIHENMRCAFLAETYELVGKPQDQGGQHEVMKVSLKLVANG
ncbi:phage head closure protein [Paenisporosarcina cavernae]|uniref:phage head closure protein n=1 Tax=Paenisporosarcina cavernae TaxID=2320858 RepID=UPI0013C52621|nr:phage head closure protein [Paenisporosarcina cavernae]